MDTVRILQSVLEDGLTLRLVEDGLYSVIPVETEHHAYDKTASFYDVLIGNGVYNRVVWGNWSSTYATYCSEALRSSSQGLVLDAGCGTLVFTADAYRRATSRPIVLLDRSLGMLRKAKARLSKGGKGIPDHIILVQADMGALPFKAGSFETVLSWGTLHVFDTPVQVMRELEKVTSATGQMFLTSLVTGRFLGDQYLRALFKAGHVASPMTVGTLVAGMAEAGFVPTCTVRGNMAHCVARKGKPKAVSTGAETAFGAG